MIEPGFLDQLERYYVSIASDSYSRRRGERESPEAGEGLTFADFRRYSPGDEPRRVDWKLYARTDELFVKQFEEERQATVHVLVDASRSMDFGGGDANKFEFGAKLGLGTAYLAARDHEQFRVSTFGERLERLDRGASNKGEVLRLVERFNDQSVDGDLPIDEQLEAYAETVDTRAVILVVSDFLSDPEELGDGLAALGDNDVVLAQVLAPEERDPPTSGDTIFAEPESGRELRTYFDGEVSEEYGERLAAHVDEVAGVAYDGRARHVDVDTGRPFFDEFTRLWT